jgi:hypothetical protein
MAAAAVVTRTRLTAEDRFIARSFKLAHRGCARMHRARLNGYVVTGGLDGVSVLMKSAQEL